MTSVRIRLALALAGLLQAASGYAAITLDNSFGTGGVTDSGFTGGLEEAREVVEQPADGKVLLVGVSPQASGPDTFNHVALVRFSSSGVLDAGFGTGGKLTFLPGPTPQDDGGGDGRAVLIQPIDNKILVAGNWDLNGGSGSQIFLARFDSAGVPDAGFGTAGVVLLTVPGLTHTTAEALLLQADGSIVVAGGAGPSGSTQGLVLRLTSAGALDGTFGTGGVYLLANPTLPGEDFSFTDLQPAGAGMVAGGGGGDLVLVRLSADGAPDAAFSGDGVAAFNVRSYTTASGTGPSLDNLSALAVLGDGRVLVTGDTGATATGSNRDVILARVTSAGALDASYGSGGFAPLADQSGVEAGGGIAVRPSGDVVIAGIGFFPTQVSPNGLASSIFSGSFEPGTADLDVRSDGSVLGGGTRFSQASETKSDLAAYRLNATDLADGTDTVPNPFGFAPQTGVEPGLIVTSNTVTISGLSAPAPIAASSGDQYAIGCTAPFVTTAGTISNGQSVCVRSAADFGDNTAKDAVLTIGTVRGLFTTVTGDSTPDQFNFVDQVDVPASTLVVSAPVSLTGFNTRTDVVISGGEYSIGCTGTFTAGPGNALPGNQVCVRHTSSSFPGGVTTTLLGVGIDVIISDDFRSTTVGTPDTTPDAFTFVDQVDVDPSTVITSAAVTITGINTPTTVTVTGGSYSIGCSATYVTSAGTINVGQTVCVRHTSAAVGLAATNTVLTVGDGSDTFTSTTRDADTTPDAFTFVDVVDVQPSTVTTSAAVTIAGINAAAPVTITGGTYSVGCAGPYTGGAGTISSGQTVCVRHTSSSSSGGVVNTTLTVGGVADTFTSTTRALDSTPDPFSFVDQTGVPLATAITSGVVLISGYDVNVAISVTGGTYSVGCGTNFSDGAGSVAPGARICVRHTSGNLGSAVTNTVLTVGGVSDTFTSTTIAGDASPTPFSFVDQTGVDQFKSITSAPVTVQGTGIAAPISITGGEYSIGCTSTFTATAGSIAPGATVCVRHRSSFESLTDTHTTLTIGDISDVFTTTTRTGDQTPDDFSFATQPPASLNTFIISEPITVSGADSPVVLNVSGPAGRVGFARECVGLYDAEPLQGSIFENGETFCVGVVSPATDLTSVVVTVNLGGSTTPSQKSATFTVTTGDTAPAAFNFTDRVGALLSATVYSDPITITGVTAPSRVVVSNGQWQLNCTGGYTTEAGFAEEGNTICLRHIAAASLSSLTNTVLTVGGVSDTFTSTTVVDKPLPGGSAMDAWSLLMLAPLLAYRRRRPR